MSRWSRFFIVIILGLVLGLLYGWVVSPVEYVDTAPVSLRADYKADYVLMVAEIYQFERDLDLARTQLAMLGDPNPADTAEAALIFAVDIGYESEDLRLLRDLVDALGGMMQSDGEAQP